VREWGGRADEIRRSCGTKEKEMGGKEDTWGKEEVKEERERVRSVKRCRRKKIRISIILKIVVHENIATRRQMLLNLTVTNTRRISSALNSFVTAIWICVVSTPLAHF
jgi:hypothetical protein